MLEYKSLEELYEFLDVPNMPRMHWSYTLGWQMAEFIYDVVKEEIKSQVGDLAVNCDQTTLVDNGS